MTLRVVTAPSVEPVSLAQAQAWLRIDAADASADEQALLTVLIQAMREYAENLTGRAFVQRSLELLLPSFPENGVIRLPRPPLISVTSVKFYDFAGTLQTVDAADYEVDVYSEPGRVQPAYLESWDGTRNVFNAVQVRYVAGYAPTASPSDYTENVPASVKLWMHARIGTLWENREQLVANNQVEIPRAFADGLLDSLRLGEVFG